MRSSVVLPQPEGPTMHTNCPLGIVRLTLSSAVRRWSRTAKTFVSPSISILSSSHLANHLERPIGERWIDQRAGFDAVLDQPVLDQPIDLLLEVAGIERTIAAECRDLHLVVQRRILHGGVLDQNIENVSLAGAVGE